MPAILKKHALHADTGKPMPKALLDKVEAARTFAWTGLFDVLVFFAVLLVGFGSVMIRGRF